MQAQRFGGRRISLYQLRHLTSQIIAYDSVFLLFFKPIKIISYGFKTLIGAPPRGLKKNSTINTSLKIKCFNQNTFYYYFTWLNLVSTGVTTDQKFDHNNSDTIHCS